MFGFETTAMLPLQSGTPLLDACPMYPADLAHARDVIIDWVRDNAYKHSMQNPNAGPAGIDFPEVRIPLRNMDTCQGFLTNDFAKQLRSYMKSIAIPVKTVIKGNKILVTVQ